MNYPRTELEWGHDVHDTTAPGHDGIIEDLRGTPYVLCMSLGGTRGQQVWLAWDRLRHRRIVVKTAPQTQAARGRLLEEARLTMRMAEAGAPTVLGIGHAADRCYLAIDWIPGVSLRPLLMLRRDATPPTSVVRRGLRILSAAAVMIHRAHERGVVHRDLKPAHLLLDARKQVRVLDWGLAAQAQAQRMDPEPVGTPPFVAPEQVGGAPPAPAADVFSLGVMAYELLTCRRLYPVQAPTLLWEHARLGPVRDEVLASLEGQHPAITQAIATALVTDPSRRAIHARGLADAIEETLQQPATGTERRASPC